MNQAVTSVLPVDVVELRIPSKAEWVSIARLATSAVASRLQFSIEDIEDVKLAVSEACINAIARGGDRIDIVCESLSNGLRIRVRDYGELARPEAVEAVAEEATAGGLGIFLIRALMDDVDYQAQAESGADLVMFKRLPE